MQDNGDNLVVTLNDKNGNACSNLWVYITIDGVTSSLKTGADGQVKLSTDGLSIGNYTAEIKFKGTTYYYSSSTTANVTITE